MRKLYAAWRGHLMILLVMVAALLVIDATNKPYNPDLVGSPQQIGIVLAGGGLLVAAFFEWCRWYNRKRGVKVTLSPEDARYGVHWPTFRNGLFLGAVFLTAAVWHEDGSLLERVALVAGVTIVLAALMAVLVRLLLSTSPGWPRLPRRRARSTSPPPQPPAAAAHPSSSE